MLDDVGNPLVILSGGGEGNADRAVVVVGRHDNDPRAGLVMGIEPHLAPDVADITALLQSVMFHSVRSSLFVYYI